MGMFDYINFEMKCPKCDNLMNNFQSKDGPCLMHNLEFYEVDYFYSGCPNCDTWVKFTLKGKRPNRKLFLIDYRKQIKKSTKKEEKAHKDKYEEFAKLLVRQTKKIRRRKNDKKPRKIQK